MELNLPPKSLEAHTASNTKMLVVMLIGLVACRTFRQIHLWMIGLIALVYANQNMSRDGSESSSDSARPNRTYVSEDFVEPPQPRYIYLLPADHFLRVVQGLKHGWWLAERKANTEIVKSSSNNRRSKLYQTYVKSRSKDSFG